MAVAPSLSTIRSSIVTALKTPAIPGVENVFDRPRWITRPERLIELFWDPADKTINTWSVEHRRGTDREMDYQFRWIAQLEFAIRGLVGFKDDADSFGFVQTLIDRIRERFHSNAAVFATPELTQRGITSWDTSIALAGAPGGSEYVVHVVELSLAVEQLEEIIV